MVNKPEPNQIRREVERIKQLSAKELPRDKDDGLAMTGLEETIQPQEVELYRPPPFVRKTATPQLVTELEGILRALREASERHVGQSKIEVEVFYAVTGEYLSLAERIRTWCQAYFVRRADPSRLSPQLGGDPFELYLKLLEEYMAIFGKLSTRGTLNNMFLSGASIYTHWLLYERLWKDLIVPQGDGSVSLRYRPAKPGTPARMAYSIEIYHLWKDDLSRFLAMVGSRVDPGRVHRLGAETDESLRTLLSGMAADIQEMRRFLVKGYNPRRTVISLGEGLAAAWNWIIRFGIASFHVGASEAEVIGYAESGLTRLEVSINHDGLLFGLDRPWITAGDSPSFDGIRPLVLNCYVLGLFHERLYSLYDRIDFERIRARARAIAADVHADEEALALSCQDLAQRDDAQEDEGPSVPTPRRRPIRSVRLQRLLALLSDRFGCEVRQGHGSEITVYRRGGKKWILGCHKRDAHVPSEVVANLLKRVGIGLDEWLDVVYS